MPPLAVEVTDTEEPTEAEIAPDELTVAMIGCETTVAFTA